jgi:hypothetical protein
MLGIVGVIYAVLLTFVAVAVHRQDFGRAETLVQNEANLVADLYRDTIAFSDTEADARNSLFVSAEMVQTDERPGMIAGRTEESAGWKC